MLQPNSALSRSAALPGFGLRQGRNCASSAPSAANARYPCIIADTPSAPTPASSTPWRCRTSSARAATLCCTPDQTSWSEYVHSRSTNWFSQSELPTASGAWSGPISTALIRVDPSSIPRAVRPAVIAAPASVVMSGDPSGARRAGAGAHQQFRRDRRRVDLLAPEPGQHELHAPAPELGEVLPYGGQRRGEVRRLGQVVETDDADVARHLQPLVVEGREQAES